MTNKWRWKNSGEKSDCDCGKIKLFLFVCVFWKCQQCAIVIFLRMKFVGIEESSWQHNKNYFVFDAFSPFLRLKNCHLWGYAWGRMGVYLGKNNLSMYFFQYIDIFLSIYRTYRYILGDISIDRYSNIFLSICHHIPPGVMLLNRSTVLRDSATNIEKTSQEGALEQERPNRNVAIIFLITLNFH